jgi:hypothetical protein
VNCVLCEGVGAQEARLMLPKRAPDARTSGGTPIKGCLRGPDTYKLCRTSGGTPKAAFRVLRAQDCKRRTLGADLRGLNTATTEAA